MDREDVHEYIKRVRPLMIEDLQFDIVEFLFKKEYLSYEDYIEIKEIETRENRIKCFLDKLPALGKGCYAAFELYIREWYEWIYTEYLKSRDNADTNSQEIGNILSQSEVPSLPHQHVSRKHEFITLGNHLHSMKRGEYVVIHGMGGCGKSTLVIEVLRQSPSLVLDTFKGKIFWLTVGRESTLKKDEAQEEVKELTILQELYTRLFIMRGYNAPRLPLDIKSAKRTLKEKFCETELQECLLILDDVPSSNFIECFNIGCKILVTTDNKNIMNESRSRIYYVEVWEGFTEEESLALFSKNLECNKSELPRQAKHVHALCKGFPLTISLVASQLAEFKEDALKNSDRWNAFIKHLENKDIKSAIGRFDQYRQEQITSLYQALDKSITSLNDSLQLLYQDFALFMDDVNIRPEVLCTLWDMSKKEVEDIMIEFEKKCLVIRTWNVQLSSYVYCVHDLLLDYLKRKLTTCERKNLHRKLISSYKTKYENDVINFPRDNYIFLYLGYHLKEADYLEDFPTLYFDLKFIEAKIQTHGPADVLYDYKKYKNFIANNEDNMKQYDEYSNFISRIGVCLLLSSSDIVQFGLAESKQSYVYRAAEQIAKNSYRKYFEYLTDVPKDCSLPEVRHYRETITAATFFYGNIILANSDGVIKLVDSNTMRSIITFKGHKDGVTHLKLSPLNMYFLSCGQDSMISMWYLNSHANLGSEMGKPRTPSPQLVQPHWLDAFPRQRLSGESPVLNLPGHRKPIIDVRFSPSGMRVVSSSLDGRVIIWKLMLERKALEELKLSKSGESIIEVKELVVSCCFTCEEDFIVCASVRGLVSIYDTVKGNLRSTVEIGTVIKSIAVIPDNTCEGIKEQAFNKVISQIQVLILGDNYLSLNNISRLTMNDYTQQSSLRCNTLSRKRHDNCICAAVSNDGQYVAVASTNYSIKVREVKSLKEVAKFHETNGRICGLHWSNDNKTLTTTYENPTWKIWNLDIDDGSNKAVKLRQSIFDATWVPYQDGDSEEDGLLITAALDVKNNINIFYDLRPIKTITEIPSGADEISHLCLCVCRKDSYLAYACKSGSVHLIMLDKWTSFDILKVDCVRVCKMKIFYHEDTMAVLLLVEKVADTYSLLGWIKNQVDDNEISGYEVEYVKENPSIFSFNVDIKNNNVYVVNVNHSCDIYDLRSAVARSFYSNDITSDFEVAKFVDFSNNFEFIATGSDSQVVLTNLKSNKSTIKTFENVKANVTKFSFDAKYLAVGFACGTVEIYDTENFEIFDKLIDHSSQVIDLTWSPIDYRLIVVLDRDIALHNVFFESWSLISLIYMSVDKVLCNNSFSKIVTVDSSGQFHVLKHPL